MNVICEFLADGKDFDLILKAPFPNIEILRWEPPHCRDTEADHDLMTLIKKATCGVLNAQAKNWYTLDNRRLYCLQRMAAEHLGAHWLPAAFSPFFFPPGMVTHSDSRHWPKRVGAVVDILYADTGRVRKKYDSTTEGRSVTISPSVKACHSHKAYKNIKKLQENRERTIS